MTPLSRPYTETTPEGRRWTRPGYLVGVEGMKLKVRYKEVHGWTEWIECLNVDVRDSWLIITLPGEKTGDICGWIAVPDHIVRGRVEVLPA